MAQRAEEGRVWVRGRGEGLGGDGGGTPAQAPHRLSPRRPVPALSPRGGRLHTSTPSTLAPSQDGMMALDIAKVKKHKEVVPSGS